MKQTHCAPTPQTAITNLTPDPRVCFHGGAFFSAIGEDFQTLERRRDVINADVLDAWFPPCPGAMEALTEHLPWLLRTSPPTHCAGLINEIASVRGVSPDNVLVGGGSSNLIFLAFRQWLNQRSRVLILDPSYGEYAHLLENVIGCCVDRFVLDQDRDYRLPLADWEWVCQQDYDLVVLVNPNNPTGQHIARKELEPILTRISKQTRVWIDEAYLDYLGSDQSIESFAIRTPNVMVCKSLSKAYALSGARVAYLCAHDDVVGELRHISPPWAVSLPAQVAAVRALQDPAYYQECYQLTHRYRGELEAALRPLVKQVVPGCANYVLCHLHDDALTAAQVVSRCRKHNVFIRDVAPMGSSVGDRAVRFAVKEPSVSRRMLDVLRRVLA